MNKQYAKDLIRRKTTYFQDEALMMEYLDYLSNYQEDKLIGIKTQKELFKLLNECVVSWIEG
jgi:hypothetical protein